VPHPVEGELEADEQHQEHETDLRERGEDRRRLRRQEGMDGPGVEAAEQGRSENHPGEDLADDRGLPDPPEEPAEELRRADDDREIRAEKQQQLLQGNGRARDVLQDFLRFPFTS
jgi:hypothetical protein